MPPLFSLAIPTRNRAGLARMSVGYALNQDFSDFEVIILDNSDRRELSEAEFPDPRCKLVPSTEVLSMRDNWERIFDIAKGEFVLVLSDKDMLLPGALKRLARLIDRTRADMITFRKACYGHDAAFHSTIQVCSGAATLNQSSEVLTSWFGQVQHYHDAPMIYNSAVRRSVFLDLKKSAGRFFTGTSPDIASGAILMAKLGQYYLLDRPLVLSWYGDWSIGVSSARGEHGAAAAHLAEYRGNPIREVGLVTTIAGSVAETLLACKSAFPDLFSEYRVHWSSYVRSVRWELLRRDRIGMNSYADLTFLRSTRNRPYKWADVASGSLRFHWERLDLPRRMRKRLLRLLQSRSSSVEETPGDRHCGVSGKRLSVDEHVAAYFRLQPSRRASFRNVPYLRISPALTFDETYAVASEINRRLDARNRKGTSLTSFESSVPASTSQVS